MSEDFDDRRARLYAAFTDLTVPSTLSRKDWRKLDHARRTYRNQPSTDLLQFCKWLFSRYNTRTVEQELKLISRTKSFAARFGALQQQWSHESQNLVERHVETVQVKALLDATLLVTKSTPFHVLLLLYYINVTSTGVGSKQRIRPPVGTCHATTNHGRETKPPASYAKRRLFCTLHANDS